MGVAILPPMPACTRAINSSGRHLAQNAGKAQRTGEGMHGNRDHLSCQCDLRRVRCWHRHRGCHGRVARVKDTKRGMIFPDTSPRPNQR